jgi:hypothetical protein
MYNINNKPINIQGIIIMVHLPLKKVSSITFCVRVDSF